MINMRKLKKVCYKQNVGRDEENKKKISVNTVEVM